MFGRTAKALEAYDAGSSAKQNIQQYITLNGINPHARPLGNFLYFFKNIPFHAGMILREKEIIFFALLQWLVIALGYLAWTQMLDWIPDSLWNAVRDANSHDREGDFTLINLVLLGWSFVIVAIASYPLGILNAAIMACHSLQTTGKPSTVDLCLRLGIRNLNRLWLFTTIDAWITVNAIVDRIPRRRNNRTAADEIAYYAWKIGTMTILPSLVAGKSYSTAASEAVQIFKARPFDAIGLRMGYSIVCWVIAGFTFVGSIAWLQQRPDSVVFAANNTIYNFYVYLAVPIILSVLIVSVVARPFYLLMLGSLYTSIIPPEDTALPATSGPTPVAFTIFLTLLGLLILACGFARPLGLINWVERLSALDIAAYIQRY